MGVERYLDKAEAFLETSFANFTESLWFKHPETVGTIRVLDAFRDRKHFPGYDIAVLDFGKLNNIDESPYIYRIKSGLIKPDSIVEVIVKRAKVKTDPVAFLVALKPFTRETYGKSIEWGDVAVAMQFGYNMKMADSSKMFVDKFLFNGGRY